MVRPKSTARDLPSRMLRRTKRLASGKVWAAYYYNGRDESGRRKEIALGSDLSEAKRKWAELECKSAPAGTGLMRIVLDRYEREVVPTKALKTQKDNRLMLVTLRAVFGSAPLEAITPQHIAQYRDNRKRKATGKPAPVQANRELALFSHVFNMAREWGYTARENPCRGVRKNKETPRDFYADDAVWRAVYACASEELKDAMDLNYLTGQRPADVLKMRMSDIRDNALEVQQNKTTRKLRILLDDGGVRTQLGRVIDRIRARKVTGLFLVAARGRALSASMLDSRFHAARSAAFDAATRAGDAALAGRITSFQFRDIRPKAASETDLAHASKLLGHTEQEITKRVYRRVGEVVKPTR